MYKLSTSDHTLSHYDSKTSKVQDITDPDYRLMLDAHVRSGDYLINLAAKLDHYAEEIKKKNSVVAHLLLGLAQDLSYVDHKYTLAKKTDKDNQARR